MDLSAILELILAQLLHTSVLIVALIKQVLKSGHACWMECGMELYLIVVVLIKVRSHASMTICNLTCTIYDH